MGHILPVVPLYGFEQAHSQDLQIPSNRYAQPGIRYRLTHVVINLEELSDYRSPAMDETNIDVLDDMNVTATHSKTIF